MQKKMRKTSIAMLLALTASMTAQDLKTNFANPPKGYGNVPFYF